MESIERLKRALHTRLSEHPDNYFTDSVWDDEVEAFCQDVDAGIRFIEEECTDEELWWLGEVYDDIMAKTQSVEFLNCLRRHVQRVENTEWKRDILEDIRTAAEYVE